ncbi:MAG: hypothetical protein Q7R40_09425 [Phaeospirillum sp.]|nr:hypothetical protein [Phaeospirillum sp.]
MADGVVYPALSFVRIKGGGIVLAETTDAASTGGDLKIRRYDGDNALSSTLVVDTAVKDNSLGMRADGTLDLFYLKASGALGQLDHFDLLKHRYSRDGGVTWSAEQAVTSTPIPITPNSNGGYGSHCYRRESDLLLYQIGSPLGGSSFSGELSSDGLSWTFYVNGQSSTAWNVVRQGGSGRIYIFSTSILTTYTRFSRGADFPAGSVLITSYASLTGYSSYSWWAFDLDEAMGRIVALARSTSGGGRWEVIVGTMDSGGITWTWSTPVVVVSSVPNCRSWLNRRKDGVWEFAYVDSGGAIQWLRCPNLTSAGAGTWS